MCVRSRTTMPGTPRSVTSASWAPAGIAEEHDMAAAATGAAPLGVGLGNGPVETAMGPLLVVGLAEADETAVVGDEALWPAVEALPQAALALPPDTPTRHAPRAGAPA